MIPLLYTLIFFCLYFGLLYPALALFGHDIYAKKNKTLTTIIRWRRREKSIWHNRTMNNLLQIVAPLIPISEKTEKKLNADLVRADIPFTAREYYAKAILSALSGIVVTMTAAGMKSWILVIGGLLMAVYMFFKNYDQVKDTLENKYALLESEIPFFIRSVESELRSDKDIIRAIERYNKIASPAMRSELEILLGDMRTSSVAQGLMRFDNRMNSPEISRLVAALVEVDRGIDASMTLQYLAKDMTVMHRQLIQRELDKRPGKMKSAIIPSAIILVVIMFYLMFKAVASSAATTF